MNLDYDPSHSPNLLPSSKPRNPNIPSPYHSNGENPYHSIHTEGSPEKDILYEYRKVQLANKIDDSLNDLYASLKASQNQLFKNYEHGRYNNNSLNFDGVYNPFERARNIGLGNGWSYRIKSYKGLKGSSPIPKFENLRYLSPSKRNGEPGDIIRTDYSSSGHYTNRVQNYMEK